MKSENVSGANMRELVATVAGPVWSDNRKSLIARAARRSGISFRQAKAIFYGEIKDPEHKSVRRLRDAAAQSGKQEAGALAMKFEGLARSMNAADQDFFSEEVAALLSAARALRGLDRTGNNER